MSLVSILFEASAKKEKAIYERLYNTSYKILYNKFSKFSEKYGEYKKTVLEDIINDLKDTADELSSRVKLKIDEIDPTSNNKYSMWIIKYFYTYILEDKIRNEFDGAISFINVSYETIIDDTLNQLDDDGMIVNEYLDLFHNNKADIKRQGGNPDIMSYKTRQDLLKVVKPYRDEGDKKEADSVEDMYNNTYYPSSGQADIISNTNEYFVVRPLTLKASKFYGCFSEWCTRFPDQFENYNKDGVLMIIIEKQSEDEIYQMFLSEDRDAFEVRDLEDSWAGDEVYEIYKKYIHEDVDKYIEHVNLSEDKDFEDYIPRPLNSNFESTGEYAFVGYENDRKFVKYKDLVDVLDLVQVDFNEDIIKQILNGNEVFIKSKYDHITEIYVEGDFSEKFIKYVKEKAIEDAINRSEISEDDLIFIKTIEDEIQTFKDIQKKWNDEIEINDTSLQISDIFMNVADQISNAHHTLENEQLQSLNYDLIIQELFLHLLGTENFQIKKDRNFGYAISNVPANEEEKMLLNKDDFEDDLQEIVSFDITLVDRYDIAVEAENLEYEATLRLKDMY